MTIKLIELMNSMLKTTYKLPITNLVTSIYYRFRSLFGQKGHDLTGTLASWQVNAKKINRV